MTENKRLTVDFDSESYYLDGEFWTSWDNYGEDMADSINNLLNKQDERIQELENELNSIYKSYSDYYGMSIRNAEWYDVSCGDDYMTENKRFTYSNTHGWQRGAFLERMNGLDEKNRKLKERIKQHEELISEQAIQLDYLQDENKHMKDVLNENKQLQPFIELANKYDKTIDELYQFIQSYLNSRNENNYWNPKNLRG